MKRIGTDGALPGGGERRELARQRLLDLAGSGGLGDAEAMAVAEVAVSRARSEAPEREGESPAPPPEEARERLGLRGPDRADTSQA